MGYVLFYGLQTLIGEYQSHDWFSPFSFLILKFEQMLIWRLLQVSLHFEKIVWFSGDMAIIIDYLIAYHQNHGIGKSKEMALW